jgi:hypothetical protein
LSSGGSTQFDSKIFAVLARYFSHFQSLKSAFVCGDTHFQASCLEALAVRFGLTPLDFQPMMRCDSALKDSAKEMFGMIFISVLDASKPFPLRQAVKHPIEVSH